MELNNQLLEIRKKRGEELEEYKKLISKIDSSHSCEKLINHHYSKLILELPFKIDAVSVNEARLKVNEAHLKEIQRRKEGVENSSTKRTLETWIESHFRTENIDNKYKRKQILKIFCKWWPQVNEMSFISNDKEVEVVTKLTKVPIEDLSHIAPIEFFYKKIEDSPFNSKSKEIFKSYLRSLIAFARERERKIVSKTRRKKAISTVILARYFEYLENRCLKANSDKASRNLVEIRFLFYVSLPCIQLKKITFADIKTIEGKNKIYCIKYKDKTYRLPSSFVEFAKSILSEKEPFLRRNIKELGSFVDKSAKAAKLQEKITPKLIQNSLESICRLEGYSVEWLPPR